MLFLPSSCVTEKTWTNAKSGTTTKKAYLKFSRKYIRRDTQKLEFYTFFLPYDQLEIFDDQRKSMELELKRNHPEYIDATEK